MACPLLHSRFVFAIAFAFADSVFMLEGASDLLGEFIVEPVDEIADVIGHIAGWSPSHAASEAWVENILESLRGY